LHRIESTQGASLSESGPLALDAVRRALAMLQSQSQVQHHPAVGQAMEAIASSLSLVHTIGQGAAVPPPLPNQAPAAFAGTVALEPNRGPYAGSPAPATQPSPIAQPQYAPQGAGGFPQGGYQQQPEYQQPHPGAGYAQPAQQQPAAPQAYGEPAQHPGAPQRPALDYAAQYAPTTAQPVIQQPAPHHYPRSSPEAHAPAQYAAPAAAAPYAQPAEPQWQNPPPAQAWQPPAAAPPAAAAPARAAAPAPGPAQPLKEGTIRVEAELGAHSATNFYKGLSGNDVIDSGGIFIATYQIPEMGQDVLIKVSMPGGYEFEAVGIVRWTRDMPHSGADAPPGFGAQFTQISPEGRQLVYRYVRNREPLFHDDL
jgi:hypothetical protein